MKVHVLSYLALMLCLIFENNCWCYWGCLGQFGFRFILVPFILNNKGSFNPEHLVVLLAGRISHTSIQYMDFVKIFNIVLDLSTIYFSHFSGC